MGEGEESRQETIAGDEARRKLASGEARAVDIRDTESVAEGTVSGSIHMGAEEIGDRLDELPTDTQLIIVDDDGEQSSEVAAKLRDEGRDAISLAGGMERWEDDRMPVQPSEDPQKRERDDSDIMY